MFLEVRKVEPQNHHIYTRTLPSKDFFQDENRGINLIESCSSFSSSLLNALRTVLRIMVANKGIHMKNTLKKQCSFLCSKETPICGFVCEYEYVASCFLTFCLSKTILETLRNVVLRSTTSHIAKLQLQLQVGRSLYSPFLQPPTQPTTHPPTPKK